MYRIAGDDWDKWSDVLSHFPVTAEHAAANLEGANGLNGLSWPDNDMLPFGYISTIGTSDGPTHMCDLTEGEQKVQMSLWCISRSPLMFGGVVMELGKDSFTLGLLTNEFVLSVNTQSQGNIQVLWDALFSVFFNFCVCFSAQISGDNDSSIWRAEQKDENTGGITYFVALFNFKSGDNQMSASFQDLGISGSTCDSLDVWGGGKGSFNGNVNANVPTHDVAFFQLTGCH